MSELMSPSMVALLSAWAGLALWASWPLVYSKPRPGEVWRFKKARGDPWNSKPDHLVTIRDYKNGWVRYDMGSSMFNDERMKVKSFVCCYEPTGAQHHE